MTEYKPTQKQKIDIVRSMVIITDTREKKNDHIIDYLKHNKINYRPEAMCVGDYTFELPDYPGLSNLNRKFIIERKASLDELAGNFTTGRDRFAREFERLTPDQNLHLVLENFDWENLYAGNYRSGFAPKAYAASLMSWSIKYNLKIWPTPRKESPRLIVGLLVKELENYLNTY